MGLTNILLDKNSFVLVGRKILLSKWQLPGGEGGWQIQARRTPCLLNIFGQWKSVQGNINNMRFVQHKRPLTLQFVFPRNVAPRPKKICSTLPSQENKSICHLTATRKNHKSSFIRDQKGRSQTAGNATPGVTTT